MSSFTSLPRTGMRASTTCMGILLAAMWLSGCRQIPLAPQYAAEAEADAVSTQGVEHPSTRSRIQLATSPPTAIAAPVVAAPTAGPRVQKVQPQGGIQVRWLAASQRPEWLQACYAPHQIDGVPHIERTVLPDYPDKMLLNDVEGRVVVVLQINSDGALGNYLIQPGAHPALAESSINAVRQWKFSIPTYRGQPVSSCLIQTFRFQIDQ